MRLHEKVALVTGAGSGIGRVAAQAFAREGARVVVADRNEADAIETASKIGEDGGEATAVTGDVTSGADAQSMVLAATESFGRLDVLLNSAGVTSRNALPQGASPEELWDKVIDVNLKGTYLVSWYAVPEMERSGGGSIINLASTVALVGYPVGIGGGFDPYPPSKGGVLQFTRTLAVASAKKNIRVNCLCPGFIATSLTADLRANSVTNEIAVERTPMGRFGRPEEVAAAALFLASDESSYVTGSPLIVDGGYTAQ